MELKISRIDGSPLFLEIDNKSISENKIKQQINEKYGYSIESIYLYKNEKNGEYIIGFFNNLFKVENDIESITINENNIKKCEFEEPKEYVFQETEQENVVKKQKLEAEYDFKDDTNAVSIKKDIVTENYEQNEIFMPIKQNFIEKICGNIDSDEKLRIFNAINEVKQGIKNNSEVEMINNIYSEDMIDLLMNNVEDYMSYIIFDN